MSNYTHERIFAHLLLGLKDDATLPISSITIFGIPSAVLIRKRDQRVGFELVGTTSSEIDEEISKALFRLGEGPTAIVFLEEVITGSIRMGHANSSTMTDSRPLSNNSFVSHKFNHQQTPVRGVPITSLSYARWEIEQ